MRAGGLATPGRAAALALAVVAAACERAPAPHATAQRLAAIVATCAAVVGDVEVRRAGRGEWSRVTTGAVLRDGDVVRTGAHAFARLEFVSGNGLELEESTVATVDVATGTGGEGAPARLDERVALASGVARGFFAGRSRAEVRPLTIRGGDGLEARLAPAGSARAVSFRLTATASGTEVAILEGAASLAARGGEVEMEAGQAVDLRGGGLGTTAELLDFPAILHPAVDQRFPLRIGEVALAWRRAAGASSYRVQIARDLSFREIVLARDVEERGLPFAPPGAGMYAWRVAARDAAGRCGEFGFARRMYFDAERLAPRGGAPARGAARAGGRGAAP